MKSRFLAIFFVIIFLLQGTSCIKHKTPEQFIESVTKKFKSKDIIGALEDCNKAIMINPKYIAAYIRRAEVKYVLGDIDGSCKDWKIVGDLGNDSGYSMAMSICGE